MEVKPPQSERMLHDYHKVTRLGKSKIRRILKRIPLQGKLLQEPSPEVGLSPSDPLPPLRGKKKKGKKKKGSKGSKSSKKPKKSPILRETLSPQEIKERKTHILKTCLPLKPIKKLLNEKLSDWKTKFVYFPKGSSSKKKKDLSKREPNTNHYGLFYDTHLRRSVRRNPKGVVLQTDYHWKYQPSVKVGVSVPPKRIYDSNWRTKGSDYLINSQSFYGRTFINDIGLLISELLPFWYHLDILKTETLRVLLKVTFPDNLNPWGIVARFRLHLLKILRIRVNENISFSL